MQRAVEKNDKSFALKDGYSLIEQRILFSESSGLKILMQQQLIFLLYILPLILCSHQHVSTAHHHLLSQQLVLLRTILYLTRE